MSFLLYFENCGRFVTLAADDLNGWSDWSSQVPDASQVLHPTVQIKLPSQGAAPPPRGRLQGAFDSEERLFVGNLPDTTTEEALKKHFSVYGVVADVHLKYDRNTGAFRSFGFVTLEDAKVARNIRLYHAQSDFEGAKIVVRAGIDSADGSSKGKYESDCRLFVGSLPDTATEASLRKHFEQYGAVADVHLKYDRNNGTFRNFGFVTFQDEMVAQYVKLYASYTEFEGARIICKAGVDKKTEGSGRLFLGGLTKDITPGMVHDHFAQYGKVLKVDVKFDKQGVCRGFGFVTMAEQSIADRIAAVPHVILEKTIDVKPAGEYGSPHDSFKGMGKGNDGSLLSPENCAAFSATGPSVSAASAAAHLQSGQLQAVGLPALLAAAIPQQSFAALPTGHFLSSENTLAAQVQGMLQNANLAAALGVGGLQAGAVGLDINALYAALQAQAVALQAGNPAFRYAPY